MGSPKKHIVYLTLDEIDLIRAVIPDIDDKRKDNTGRITRQQQIYYEKNREKILKKQKKYYKKNKDEILKKQSAKRKKRS